jgi:hypothetical protein
MLKIKDRRFAMGRYSLFAFMIFFSFADSQAMDRTLIIDDYRSGTPVSGQPQAFVPMDLDSMQPSTRGRESQQTGQQGGLVPQQGIPNTTPFRQSQQMIQVHREPERVNATNNALQQDVRETREHVAAIAEQVVVNQEEVMAQLRQLQDDNARLQNELLRKRNGWLHDGLRFAGMGIRGVGAVAVGYWTYSWAATIASFVAPVITVSPLAPFALGFGTAAYSYFRYM